MDELRETIGKCYSILILNREIIWSIFGINIVFLETMRRLQLELARDLPVIECVMQNMMAYRRIEDTIRLNLLGERPYDHRRALGMDLNTRLTQAISNIKWRTASINEILADTEELRVEIEHFNDI